MNTKVGRQALKELTKRMDRLNVEFKELGQELEKLKGSDFGSNYYEHILEDAKFNRADHKGCQEEIARLIELEKSVELFK